MTQMNKGSGKPFQPGINKARTAPGNLAAAQQSLTAGKALKQEGLAKSARAEKNAGGLPGWANASNRQNAQNAIQAGKAQISQAKKDIKANTKSNFTIGADRPKTQTVKLGPTQLGAGKLNPQSASLGSKQLGQGTLPKFKQASPSNPMGRMGGKPGVNIGTSKFK